MSSLPATGFDSVTAGDIPADAVVVMGYGERGFAWSDADWRRFPRAVKVKTVTHADVNDGDELDCETGDATAAQTAGWVKMRRASGYRGTPGIYMNLSTWPAVRNVIEAAGERCVYRVADWTGRPHSLRGAWAVQYADPVTSGGHFDLNLVYDLSWLPGQAKPAHAEETTMITTTELIVGEQHTFAVNAAGQLVHRWQPLGGGWRREVLTEGLVPLSPVSSDGFWGDGNWHLFAQSPEGLVHVFYIGPPPHPALPNPNVYWLVETVA